MTIDIINDKILLRKRFFLTILIKVAYVTIVGFLTNTRQIYYISVSAAHKDCSYKWRNFQFYVDSLVLHIC